MASFQYRRRLVFPLLVIVLSFLVFVYPVIRLTAWYDGTYQMGIFGSLLLWFASIVCLRTSFGGPAGGLRYFTVHWLGVSFVFLILVLGYEGLRFLDVLNDRVAAVWLLGVGTIICLIAVGNAHYISVKRIEISSDKVRKHTRFVQISDIHIGSRQSDFMTKIVAKINKLNPNYVVITGDLVDTSTVGYTELQALKDIITPTYFVTGNHDRYAGLDHVLPVLTSLDVVVLRNEELILDDIQLIGIDDEEHAENLAECLQDIDIDADKYRVLLHHKPVGWSAAIEHGIELMLSGHTHNGQIFPFNYIVRTEFEYLKGLHSRGDSHLYVSSGTGTWGPLMRLGSVNEITCIDLIPA